MNCKNCGLGDCEELGCPAPVPAPAKKESNPKYVAASKRLPLDLIPATAEVEHSLALAEGAWKYGEMNWRVAGARTSTYIAAMLRHIKKFQLGEDRDPVSMVHHLGKVQASCTIIMDAQHHGVLEDDRSLTDKDRELAEHMDDRAAEVLEHIQLTLPNVGAVE